VCISTQRARPLRSVPQFFLTNSRPWISLSTLSIQRRLIILSEGRPSPASEPYFPPQREARRPQAWAGMSPTNQPSIGLGSILRDLAKWCGFCA